MFSHENGELVDKTAPTYMVLLYLCFGVLYISTYSLTIIPGRPGN